MSNDIQIEVLPSDVGGAPTKYTPSVVGKLVAAFNNGYSITEACQFAGIHRDTYYDWLEHQNGFSDKMEEARGMVNRVAKEKVVDAISKGDVQSARWWLERRDKQFKAKVEVDPGEHTRKTRDKIKEFLNESTDHDSPAPDGTPDAASAEPASTTAGESDTTVETPASDIS